MECGVALMCHTNNFHFYSKEWYGGPEMPTSGDKIKSGDSLFCITPPPPHQMSTAPTSPTPPAHKLTQPPWLRTLLWSLTWGTWQNNLCQRLTVGKNVLETLQWIKKVWIVKKKWAKFQTLTQESWKVHFMREIWWPTRKSWRSVPCLVELAYMFGHCLYFHWSV